VLEGFQNLDFFSQTACGAGAIGMNAVNNCNGSNMGFRRSAFTEVGGYAAISHVNSGSDSLLAQRIVAMTEWKMRFAFEPKSHISTAPLKSWRQVLEQRMRWVGQTPNYRPSTLLFLGASFLLYLTLFLFTPLTFIYWPGFPTPLIILIVKLAVDFSIISKFMKLTGTGGMMKFFLISELIHIPVVLMAVCGSFLGSFEWKGRRMRREMPQQR
jgi:cellulose synthase/poly-beta-1,6-N-acetylglucosamine synthase-like glycosyltransferase